jgi:hypothetical protein
MVHWPEVAHGELNAPEDSDKHPCQAVLPKPKSVSHHMALPSVPALSPERHLWESCVQTTLSSAFAPLMGVRSCSWDSDRWLDHSIDHWSPGHKMRQPVPPGTWSLTWFFLEHEEKLVSTWGCRHPSCATCLYSRKHSWILPVGLYWFESVSLGYSPTLLKPHFLGLPGNAKLSAIVWLNVPGLGSGHTKISLSASSSISRSPSGRKSLAAHKCVFKNRFPAPPASPWPTGLHMTAAFCGFSQNSCPSGHVPVLWLNRLKGSRSHEQCKGRSMHKVAVMNFLFHCVCSWLIYCGAGDHWQSSWCTRCCFQCFAWTHSILSAILCHRYGHLQF